MKKSRIIVSAFFTTITLAGCTNNQDKQLQQQNDFLNQENTSLQQNDAPGNVVDTTNTPNTNATVETKTIPFEAVDPANKPN